MPIFSDSNTIIKAVESHLVSESESTYPQLEEIKRSIWLPPKFISTGINEKLKSINKWTYFSAMFFFILLLIFNKTGGAILEIINIVLWVATLVSLFLVTFALPSTYGHSGVSQESVDFVVIHLKNRCYTDINDIELLRKSVKIIEDSCRVRTNTLKWLVGLLWASFIYIFSKGLEHPNTDVSEIVSHSLTLDLLIFGLFVGYLGVWGYEAALDKLFRTIEFGCNDFCYSFDK